MARSLSLAADRVCFERGVPGSREEPAAKLGAAWSPGALPRSARSPAMVVRRVHLVSAVHGTRAWVSYGGFENS
eukprot:Skav208581  [mRNA]  locus=scaffold3325:242948:243169:- [translate_table: standard]